MSETARAFTKADGIKVQKVDLQMWRPILSDYAYEKLESHCDDCNSKIESDGPESGFLIFRGQSFGTFIANLAEGI